MTPSTVEQLMATGFVGNKSADAVRRELEQLVHGGFGYLVRALWSEFKQMGRDIASDDPLLQDAVQEAFIKVWQRPDGFDADKGTLTTYVVRTARNAMIDAYRRTWREVPVDPQDGNSTAMLDQAVDLGQIEQTIDQILALAPRDLFLVGAVEIALRSVALRFGPEWREAVDEILRERKTNTDLAEELEDRKRFGSVASAKSNISKRWTFFKDRLVALGFEFHTPPHHGPKSSGNAQGPRYVDQATCDRTSLLTLMGLKMELVVVTEDERLPEDHLPLVRLRAARDKKGWVAAPVRPPLGLVANGCSLPARSTLLLDLCECGMLVR